MRSDETDVRLGPKRAGEVVVWVVPSNKSRSEVSITRDLGMVEHGVLDLLESTRNSLNVRSYFEVCPRRRGIVCHR